MNKTRTWKFFSVLMALALVVSLGAAIVPASPAQAVSSKLIGTDTAGDGSTGADRLILGKFQTTTTGLVNEIRVYSLAAGNVEVAIYQDNAGSPGEIISSVGDAQPISAGEWNTITFPDTPVTEGTDYWLAVASDVTGAVVHCSASSGGNGFYWEVIEFDSFVWLDNPAWEGNSKGYNISIAGWGN